MVRSTFTVPKVFSGPVRAGGVIAPEGHWHPLLGYFRESFQIFLWQIRVPYCVILHYSVRVAASHCHAHPLLQPPSYDDLHTPSKKAFSVLLDYVHAVESPKKGMLANGERCAWRKGLFIYLFIFCLRRSFLVFRSQFCDDWKRKNVVAAVECARSTER